MGAAQHLVAGLDAASLAYALVVVFAAAVVRGYSGFGSSALFVTSLTLVLPPAEVVPITLFLEIAASLGLLSHAWKDVSWRAIGWLLVGAALGMPVGFTLLAELPADPMRIAISLLVLGASLMIWFGYRVSGRAGVRHTVGTGALSGLANGIAGVGGLPVVLFFLSTSAAATMTRATLIVYLMSGDIYGAAVAGAHGLVTTEVVARAALFCVPLFVGVWVGHRRFLRASPDSFRRFTLVLLMFLSSLGLVRAGFG